MESQHKESERPSFFSWPASFRLWSGLGQTFWGGLLGGIGLGLFFAKFLQDLDLWRYGWVGFVAIALVGTGPGLALRAVRHKKLTAAQGKAE